MSLLGKWLESLDFEYKILPSCTRNKSPRSTCLECVTSCGEQAIKIVDNMPVINHDKCSECGHCVSACPVQAVEGIFPKRTIIQNQLVLSGRNFPSAKELLVLYKKGIQTIRVENEAQLENAKATIEEANILLDQLGEAPFIILIKTIEKNEQTFSRRELFTHWKKESKSVLKDFAPATWRFNQSHFDLSNYYKGYQFAKIEIETEKCTLCNACQRLCEKNCFDIGEEHFIISADKCSACQLCADICPEKAITIEKRISKKDEITLSIYKKICSNCSEEFSTLSTKDEECQMCTKRKAYMTI